ncbi:hypothetical protein [Rhodococcus maanshanensis]|uniref:Uncharacterized protein n=1 Tax=Rhodococcus maanshanensis TaxID=183556 RepID=A0A1H7W3N2_9NOCA|nr:hypothetical protein [Rhodococcus maanshanensis]SEM16081.1 hypothetical protein SAMN05444583_12467 [Rhodococcus maanshanensis]
MAIAGQLARAGGAVLAALTVVAGGAGLGTAAAASTAPESAEPMINFLALTMLGSTSTDHATCVPGDPDPMPCDNGTFHSSNRGELGAVFSGPHSLKRGENVQLDAQFFAFAMPNGGLHPSRPDKVVTSATIKNPDGFVFAGGDVTAYTHDEAGAVDSGSVTALDATFTVDPVTGDVTATPPAGGWDIPSVERAGGGFSSGMVHVKVNYQATELVRDGEAAVGFIGTGVPVTEWLPSPTIDVMPELGGSGS